MAVLDFPDATSMAAVSMAVKAGGAVRTRAAPLLTVEQIDEATREQVTFRPPRA